MQETGSNPVLGRSSGEGNGNPIQYSFLQNPMHRGAWQAVVHRVSKSQIQLKQLHTPTRSFMGLPSGSDGKEAACNAGDLSLIPGLIRSPGEENGYPFQHSCLQNSMDRRSWRATVHGVAKTSKEQVSFNFMATVMVCSDFGAQENKIGHCFHFSSSICHEVMGLDAMILGF